MLVLIYCDVDVEYWVCEVLFVVGFVMFVMIVLLVWCELLFFFVVDVWVYCEWYEGDVEIFVVFEIYL